MKAAAAQLDVRPNPKHSRMRKVRLLALLLVAGIPACSRPAPRSQFGAYSTPTLYLRLVGGDSIAVYRVKYWTFSDGSPPATQLEFEPPFDVEDTSAVKRYAREVWPSFAPYVDRMGTPGAILTATNLRVKRQLFTWTSTTRHYGLVLHRGEDGRWRVEGDSVPFPDAAQSVGVPKGPGVFNPDGRPFEITSGPPAGAP